MKLMKKVLVLALAAATILMAACNNGNGGEPSIEYVAPTLPESKGTDPFTSLETLTSANSTSRRYLVDTTKKMLTEQSLATDGKTWSPTAEYSYSYDGTVTPPTITGRLEAQYNKEGTRLTPADELAAYEAEAKKNLELYFDTISAITDPTARQTKIDADINKLIGLSLTAEDFTPAKKDATVETMWNSKFYQDSLKEQKQLTAKQLAMTPTYAVTLTGQSGTTAKLAVEGQYNSSLQWYEQQAGSFSYTSTDDTIRASFSKGSGNIYYRSSDTSYNSSAFTASSIICKSNRSNETKTFTYKITGSGKDTVVTITVDDSQNIECKWQPSTTIGQ